jgi:hypothetical protein
MSIRLLQNPRTPHELFDDLESVYWTMFYGALHRFRHTRRITNMDMFSESAFEADGDVTGGDRKLSALVLMKSLLTFECRPLKALFVSLAKALHAYYTALFQLDSDEECDALDSGQKDSDSAREAQATLDFHYQRLSKPSFWREQLKRALSMDNWIDNDVVEEDWYEKQTQEEATQKFEFVSRTSNAQKKRKEGTGANHQETDNLEEAHDSGESSCEEDGNQEIPAGNSGFDGIDGIGPIPDTQQNTGSPRPMASSLPTSPSVPQFALRTPRFKSPASEASDPESQPATAKRSFFEDGSAVAGPSNAEPGRRQKRFKVALRDQPSSPSPAYSNPSVTERSGRAWWTQSAEPSSGRHRNTGNRHEHWMVTRARARGSGKPRTAE